MSSNADGQFNEYQESTTVTLEWTVRGLKQLFDSSKGDTKSKVTKSVIFSGGRWQILFYPNSGLGTDGGGYLSIYLSCEPTAEERDAAVNGRWIREGRYKFSFELRKTVLFVAKEANDHSFTWKTANWGWAQFARRDSVYYNPNSVRIQDAFLITCTINSTPSPPVPPLKVPYQTVPRDLLDVVGALMDDPVYSDVEFVLPKSRCANEDVKGKQTIRRGRRIFAARKILMRAEYFAAMFNSGFSEATLGNYVFLAGTSQMETDIDPTDKRGNSDSDVDVSREFDDSDIEDEEMIPDTSYESDEAHNKPAQQIARDDDQDIDVVASKPSEESKDDADTRKDSYFAGMDVFTEAQCSVRAKIPCASTPERTSISLEGGMSHTGISASACEGAPYGPSECALGPRKTRVVVQDVAYATYRAVLYYLYTNTILFAPLSSSFLTSNRPPQTPRRFGPQVVGGGLSNATRNHQGEGPVTPSTLIPPSHPHQPNFSRSVTSGGDINNVSGPATRIAWIKEWSRQNPGRVPPCSAKAVYRLADKLNLVELKSRAFDHVVKSLTVENVPFEMFTSFSATFEDIRKVQVAFFLENWNDIRGSDAMRSIWQQIRVGRHPGFEEVWPLIAMNLEFKPQINVVVSGDNKDGGEREK